MLGFLIAAGVVVGVVFLLLFAFRSMYKVAEPNEALVVSGFGAYRQNDNPAEASTLGFKIVVGKGVFVFPLVQNVRRLSLELHKAELIVDCVTTQGIPVHVRGVVVYKVGDDFAEIANAARRFLDKEGEMDANVHEVFAGHLRQIVGSLTVEDMIRAREKLPPRRELVRDRDGEARARIDSLQIQQVEDPTGYIENLAKPFQAAVAAEARIAAAERDREATEREQAAAALKAQAVSASLVEQAQRQAEADRAKAVAAQAGPLSDAEARKAVVVQETEVASSRLSAPSSVCRRRSSSRRRPSATRASPAPRRRARRSSYAPPPMRRASHGGGGRCGAAQAPGRGGGLRDRAHRRGRGEGRRGCAARRRARRSMRSYSPRRKASRSAPTHLRENQEAVINQSIAEQLPQIVEAAAGAYKGVDHMVVLNGAEGMGNITGQVLGTGLLVIPMIRDVFANGLNGGRASTSENGEKPAGREPLKRAEPKQ